jgi:hypothetical protein
MLKILIELIVGYAAIFIIYSILDYIQRKFDFEELYSIILISYLSWQAILLGEYLLKLTY